jgi:hypothetical protein
MGKVVFAAVIFGVAAWPAAVRLTSIAQVIRRRPHREERAGEKVTCVAGKVADCLYLFIRSLSSTAANRTTADPPFARRLAAEMHARS